MVVYSFIYAVQDGSPIVTEIAKTALYVNSSKMNEKIFFLTSSLHKYRRICGDMICSFLNLISHGGGAGLFLTLMTEISI